jgi:hypothetical protein
MYFIQLIISANLIFTLDHHIRPFEFIEGYLYDVYFTTIVYQVSRKLVLIKKSSKYYRVIFYATHAVLIFFLLFLTVTFILRNIFTYYNCEEIWFLVLNIVEILLSILMVIAGKCHEKKQ